MSTAKAQAAQVLVAREGTPGTAPSSGWLTVKPNPSGIQNFHPEYVDVRSNPLSPYMTDEKGDHVGLNAAPTLVCDLSKGFMDVFGPGFLRSVPKVPGDEPTTQIYYPTAAADGGGSQDSFTVSADGDLLNGTIVRSRGFVNAANNDIFVLEGTSTTVAIKVPTATLVAETIAAGNAQVQVAGFQFQTADLTMTAGGDLATSSQDLTVFNLVDGQLIYIGGTDTGDKFATIDTGSYAYVDGTVTTNLIPLKWHSFTPGADSGTGKTVQLFWGVCYRNVPDGHADYIEEPSWAMELRDTGVGSANAAVYSYALGAVMNTISIAMGVESKIEVTANFIARSIGAPVEAGNRISGPSSAYPSIAQELHDTANDLIVHRILNADDDSTLIAEVNSCTLTIEHGVTPRKQLTTFGAAGMVFGNIRPMLEMETYFERRAVPVAIEENTTCRYEAIMVNGQGGIAFALPGITLRNGAKTYAENSPVMMAIGAPAHRDPNTNVVMIINVLPYVPQA